MLEKNMKVLLYFI